MSKEVYNKLIRDRITEIIKENGRIPEISILGEDRFREALKAKMTEEAKELLEAKTKEEVLNELADIEELIRAISKNYGISSTKIEKYRLKKLKNRGGFEKKLFLKRVK